ncbi:hypothetical protein FB45DRAFT_904458 [Roridomyces roridus]|uniref:Uncharacterized protein n=1 Tax=Roridomyces roridus TaxID=1738132 RepID=A0AAD7FRG1_9AGAR|nr:hypothetical protein FB45DRAFT_904458 [Roridomyces roridus]
MPSSELCDALNPNPRPRNNTYNTQQSSPALHRPNPPALTVQEEVLALLAATKQEAELERTRRVAWEAEMEAKYVQRHAEMERQMSVMRTEIANLRALLTGSTPLTSPAIANLGHPQPPPIQQLQNAEYSFMPSPSSTVPSKRPRAELSTDDESGNISDTSETSLRPRRTDHRDKRILTVQAAMRAHILLLMDLENDKTLPDSHLEGLRLDPPNAVRFVWEKTTKQSTHNGRMKNRVVDDFRDRRHLYKHVADREFNKKIVDTAFEQCFTTLRQKFRTQHDVVAASRHKEREGTKARKSRHVARRKTKLDHRADARLKLDSFQHVAFDGAMQIECMSSEESESETNPTIPRGTGPLQTRGYPWRSRRLLQFYTLLDVENSMDTGSRPQRGVGRRERFIGPHKQEPILPPKGVSSWMISRRWMMAMQAEHPDLVDALRGLVFDAPGVDWMQFSELGGETDDEEYMPAHMIPPNNYTTSSLQCALV